MITRLYVDNFKCMVNFEYQPASLHLIFGENGNGKTATFEVLEKLRDHVVSGTPTEQLFPSATLTAGQTRPEQTFDLEIEGNGGRYAYHLVIEHDRDENKNRITKEELRFEGNMLYAFDGQNAHLLPNESEVCPFRRDHACRWACPLEPQATTTRIFCRPKSFGPSTSR